MEHFFKEYVFMRHQKDVKGQKEIMRMKVGIIKRVSCISLVFLLSLNSFAAIVSDNDGAAFITKAEFDALKNDFQSQIDSYNTSIDNKIDGAIASYLAGIKLSTLEQIDSLYKQNQDKIFWYAKCDNNNKDKWGCASFKLSGMEWSAVTHNAGDNKYSNAYAIRVEMPERRSLTRDGCFYIDTTNCCIGFDIVFALGCRRTTQGDHCFTPVSKYSNVGTAGTKFSEVLKKGYRQWSCTYVGTDWEPMSNHDLWTNFDTLPVDEGDMYLTAESTNQTVDYDLNQINVYNYFPHLTATKYYAQPRFPDPFRKSGEDSWLDGKVFDFTVSNIYSPDDDSTSYTRAGTLYGLTSSTNCKVTMYGDSFVSGQTYKGPSSCRMYVNRIDGYTTAKDISALPNYWIWKQKDLSSAPMSVGLPVTPVMTKNGKLKVTYTIDKTAQVCFYKSTTDQGSLTWDGNKSKCFSSTASEYTPYQQTAGTYTKEFDMVSGEYLFLACFNRSNNKVQLKITDMVLQLEN